MLGKKQKHNEIKVLIVIKLLNFEPSSSGQYMTQFMITEHITSFSEISSC